MISRPRDHRIASFLVVARFSDIQVHFTGVPMPSDHDVYGVFAPRRFAGDMKISDAHRVVTFAAHYKEFSATSDISFFSLQVPCGLTTQTALSFPSTPHTSFPAASRF